MTAKDHQQPDATGAGEPGEIRGWPELLHTEDYWAIWLGLILIVAALIVYLPRPPAGLEASLDAANTTMRREEARAPLRTVAWYEALDAKARLKGTGEPHGKTLMRLLAKPHGWENNPLHSLLGDEARAAELRAAAEASYAGKAATAAAAKNAAQAIEALARASRFDVESLNEAARTEIAAWRDARSAASSAAKKTRAAAYITSCRVSPWCACAWHYCSASACASWASRSGASPGGSCSSSRSPSWRTWLRNRHS